MSSENGLTRNKFKSILKLMAFVEAYRRALVREASDFVVGEIFLITGGKSGKNNIKY